MMNERLTELYRECRTKEALASQDEYKSSNTLLGLEVEKFAELIVKECADVATINQFQYDAAGNYVLKHFGVGE
jgi:hypothetical protein